jgi:nucleotide-binding universal stress UspA family protein
MHVLNGISFKVQLTNMFDPIFSRIMVAYDGSEPSTRALDLAAKTAAMFKGELVILTVVSRVVPLTFTEGGEGPIIVSDVQRFMDVHKEVYQRSLEEAETEVRERYPGLKFEALLLEGRPSATIVEVAEERDVNLIMIGSRGLGRITGWILGDTSRRVVDQCTKPILVVK